MDFGLVGLDSFVPATNNGGFSLENSSDPANNKQKWPGFGFLKQNRAVINEDIDDLRDFKVAKTCSSSSSYSSHLVQRSNYSDGRQQQMLSFSSPNSQTFPSYYHQHLSSASGRSAGYGSTGMNVSGARAPFTPSQWMELEHQALIYKYITANVPIPSYLLNPIRKAFESAGFNGFSTLRSSALGWGAAFHLGFSNSDPEPGRCRRTDGKKWRCSRDAVADQKYCERHMNRGRHRSRKPVEAQPAAAAVTAATAKPAASTAVAPAGAAPPTALYSGLMPNMNRNVKQNEEETSSLCEFGLVCSDSLLNPLNRSSSLVQENKSQHSLRQFMDEWPKNQREQQQVPSAGMSWPEMTQLSISIPVATSSPPGELEMGLGVGPNHQRQSNWVPISWEPSLGGPLGEVLHTTNNESKATNTKPLNLIDRWDNNNNNHNNYNNNNYNNSPRMGSSPTGVLQRGAFVSLSNSSAGSSPRGESSRVLDGVSLCNNPSLPAL